MPEQNEKKQAPVDSAKQSNVVTIDSNKIIQRGFWTAQDVAREAQVCERTVANWRTSRRIPFVKIGRSVRFVPENVCRALAAFEVKSIRCAKNI